MDSSTTDDFFTPNWNVYRINETCLKIVFFFCYSQSSIVVYSVNVDWIGMTEISVSREKVKIFDNEEKKSENRFCAWLHTSVISDWKK